MTGTGNDCGCCAGTTTETPAPVRNAPGLPAIAYRVGTHASFKSSLLARLSSQDFPALAGLGTRRDDDWTIGLCDAFATMADVLTFYQERIANESFLRTAVERRSVLELSRMVGYELAPGVAANTVLAFTMDVPLTPNAPPPQPVTIPRGTRLQSVPEKEEVAQTFETSEDIVGRAQWNALAAQTVLREQPYAGQTVMWLDRADLGLSAGDVLAIVGAERFTSDASNLWEVRKLTRVDVDAARRRTRVEWENGLGHFAARGATSTDGARIYVMRQRAALFGSNAIDPNTIDWDENPAADQVVDGNSTDGFTWKNFDLAAGARTLEFDTVYPKITARSWLALTGSLVTDNPHLHGDTFLYWITAARAASIARYALAGRSTIVTVSPDEHVSSFNRRDASVYAQSEELAVADRPLTHPLYGDRIALATRELDLAARQLLALHGRRQRIVAPANPAGIAFPDDAGRTALPGESFAMLAPPLKIVSGQPVPIDVGTLDGGLTAADLVRWTLLDRDGKTVTLQATGEKMKFSPALESDPWVDEIASIANLSDAVTHDIDRTTLRLSAPLANCYDRATLTINANVARATQGESVGEVAGSGDGAAINQRFALRQAPLTYVSADNPQGRQAELSVFVNDIEWHEAPSLYARAPAERVYALRQDDDGRSSIQFGDGVEGARLPTGTDNVRLEYRKGLGAAGNVRAGTITSLVLRPIGVRAAVNPLAASGGEDAESRDDARRNSPLTVLTLDRAVSVLDYGDFARAYAGVAKAVAAWIPAGNGHGMHVTIAGANGSAVTGDTLTNLRTALHDYGDELLNVSVLSYSPATFVLRVRIVVQPDHEPEQALAAVRAALLHDFAFDARDFGKPVTIDEVTASVHRVAAVLAVDIDALHRSDAAAGPQPEPRLFPSPGTVLADGTVTAAELLTIDAATLSVEVMT